MLQHEHLVEAVAFLLAEKLTQGDYSQYNYCALGNVEQSQIYTHVTADVKCQCL